MSGSFSAPGALPRPPELLLRALVASVLVLGALHALQWVIIRPLIPLFCAAVHLLSLDFTIYSAQAVQTGAAQHLIVIANLAAPLEIAGRLVYPIGWNASSPQGGYQVSLSLGGLLQYSALLLIVAFTWPSSGIKESAVRAAICLPLILALLFLEVPLTIVAELTVIIADQLPQPGVDPWMVWSRFLMGGGGLLLGALFGATAIVIAKCVIELPRRIQKSTDSAADRFATGEARLIVKRIVDADSTGQ
jgi:hypothetical protein